MVDPVGSELGLVASVGGEDVVASEVGLVCDLMLAS